MKQIKIFYKGACRYVPVSNPDTLNKLIEKGWEPARDSNGKLIAVELNNVKSSNKISKKTSEILRDIQNEINESIENNDNI